MTAQTRSIVVAAMVVTDPVGRVLCVRKRGTDTFMLPGGKFEPGESVDHPEVTAAREVSEELGVDIELSQLRPWNIARAAAANEAGFEVVGHHVRYVGEFTDELANVQPHAEIEEVRWLDPWLPTGKIAPMLVETTLPKLREELPQLAAGREQPQRALSSAAPASATIPPGASPPNASARHSRKIGWSSSTGARRLVLWARLLTRRLTTAAVSPVSSPRSWSRRKLPIRG